MAHADDKIVSIRAAFGMWGVGTYWTLVERAAEQMKGKSPDPTATILVPELCSFLGCKRNKLVSFLDHLQNVGGMKHELNGDVLKITVCKLLEIKDNYQKDLEETSKRLPSKEVEVEEDVEVDKSTDTVHPSDFKTIWKLYPNRQGRKNAERHFFATVKSQDDLNRIRSALDNYLKSGNVARGFVKNGSTWFNEWEDWVSPTETMMKGNTGENNSGRSGKANATTGVKPESGKYDNVVH